MSVDIDHGEDLTLHQAQARIVDGDRIVVRSQQVAREVLIGFGLTPAEADTQIRFGRTGRLD